MLIMGVDTESNHFDPELARMTEFGMVLWDTELGLPVEIESHIVKEVDLGPLSDKIIELTGITNKMVEDYGKSPYVVFDRFMRMYSKADYMLAHNGNNFDRPFIKNFFNRYLTDDEKKLLYPKHWIDSLTDVDYPDICSHRSMTYLQGFYGILNPFKHRAVTDILTTLTILHKNFDWNDILELSKSPTLRFIAEVDYHDRDVAKDQKFKFTKVPYNAWYRDIKKLLVDRKNITKDFNFKYGVVKPDWTCAKEFEEYRCLCKECQDQRYREYVAKRSTPTSN